MGFWQQVDDLEIHCRDEQGLVCLGNVDVGGIGVRRGTTAVVDE